MRECYEPALGAFIQTIEWELACDREQHTAARC